MQRWFLLGLVATLAIAATKCGSSSPTTSTGTPAPVTPTPPSGNYTVTGLIADLPGANPLPNATVAVVGGPNTGRSTVSGSDGRYSLTSLVAGSTTLQATASGYAATQDSIVIPSDTHADFRLPALVPPPVAAAQCNPSLWPHMHDVQRIHIVTPCVTVTGTIATVGSSDDGDIDMQLTLDSGFGNLLNSGNTSKLNGNLQTEAICQAPVHPDVPDAQRTCANFNGTVPIPAVGTHVRITGVHVLDSDHGWMEIHPISVLTAAR